MFRLVYSHQPHAPVTRRRVGGIAASLRRTALFPAVGLALAAGTPVSAAAGKGLCWAEPVATLSYGSRYAEGSVTKDVVDAVKSAAVDDALQPVDDFVRELTRHANRAVKGMGSSAGSARCALEMLTSWAEGDALSRLETKNARMTLGARLAGIGISYSQVADYATPQQRAAIDAWLSRRLAEQLEYWDSRAPSGASRGNLKAWASLAAVAVGIQIGDEALTNWGARETKRLLCSVDPEGALPREMERGARALHYHLHALSALSSSVALLERAATPIAGVCEDALARAVWFAVRDIDSGGALSQAKTGRAQTYFTGSDRLRPHHVAFGAAFLFVSKDPKFAAWIERFGSLNNSKLGGNQYLLWG